MAFLADFYSKRFDMRISVMVVAAFVLFSANPARATSEEDEVAYILFGVNKQELKTDFSRIEANNGRGFISVVRKDKCIYDVLYSEVMRGSSYRVNHSYYVDLSDLSGVDLFRSSANKHTKIRLIGGYAGCPAKIRNGIDGCATDMIGTFNIDNLNRSARSFSERFCGLSGTRILTWRNHRSLLF